MAFKSDIDNLCPLSRAFCQIAALQTTSMKDPQLWLRLPTFISMATSVYSPVKLPNANSSRRLMAKGDKEENKSFHHQFAAEERLLREIRWDPFSRF
jgi:hypothetical protein